MHIDPHDIAICVGDEEAGRPAPGSPMAPPIVQTSLFSFPDFDSLIAGLAQKHRHHVYTRGQNPTVEAVERKLAVLEGGETCKCFGSGMAAINAVMQGVLGAGDHILFVNQTYGPTLQLAEHLRRFGVEHDVQLDLEPPAIEAAIRPNTRLIWLESPSTMLFRVVDVGAVASMARPRGIATCLDNSWATPLLQKPLAQGVDIVVHSATKYIGGHSDVVAGAVITTAERMRPIFERGFMLGGGLLAPFDAWLLYRGLRTLPVRLQQHEADALAVARFLEGHPAVHHVYHPAFAGNRQLVAAQLRGFSGLFSFALVRDDFDGVRRVIDGLRRFRIGVSWGGVESLVISPVREGNRARLEAQGIPPGLIRLSVGLEGADALIQDLDTALRAVS
jgi:cystathionine beta-lyase/cystathionine gamma-synthase